MANRISLIRENCFRETLQITRSVKIVYLENLALYGSLSVYIPIYRLVPRPFFVGEEKRYIQSVGEYSVKYHSSRKNLSMEYPDEVS